MRAVLPVRGSIGDMRPAITVGRALHQHGHEVLVVSHCVYEPLAAEAGLGFRALDEEADYQAFAAAFSLLQEARGGAEFWRRHVIPRLYQETMTLLELCRSQPALLVLQPIYDMAGRFAAELLGLPATWVFISPAMVSGLPMRVGLVEELGPELNEVRRALGLTAITDFQSWMSYSRENVALWPEWFAPDLHRTDIIPVGFPPVECANACGSGSRVLVTGSTGRFLPGSLFDVAVAACARLQLPALVMSRFPDLLPRDLPPGVEVTGFQPHSLVMAQATAVIHHGGIGTTVSALAHGRPQLVLAAGADRPDNGLRLESLGLGRCLLTVRWTPSDVAAALHDVLTSPTVRERCRYYQGLIREGSSSALIVELLERAAHTPWNPPAAAARATLDGLSPDRRKLAEKLLRRRRQQQPTQEPAGPRRATTAQQRLWIVQQLDPTSSAFNKVHGVRLSGPLDRTRLEQSLQALLTRHQVLRTNLRWVEADLLEVDGGEADEWVYSDLRAVDPTMHWQEIQRIGLHMVARPYDLAQGPLLRPHLVQLADDEHVWLVGLHAAVGDAASTEVMWRDLGQLYGRQDSLPQIHYYGRYARALEASLDSSNLVEWWRGQLDGLVETDPPLARPRPDRLSSAGDGFILVLPKARLTALETLARSRGVTLFVLLLAAFKALLLRYTGQLDLVVGTRVACRAHPDALPLIGPLANTLVLRTRADGDPTFLEWVERVGAMWSDTQAHQSLPFQALVEALQPPRRANRHPFFSVVFYLQGEPAERVPWGDLEARPVLLKRGTTTDDLVLSCRSVADELRCLFEYRTDLYAAETVQVLGQDWARLLEEVCAAPDTRLSDLPPQPVPREPPQARPKALPTPPPNGPPCGPLEAELAGLFARALGRPSVQRHDNFFSLGGHSMLAAHLTMDIERRTGRKVSLTTLFEAPSVADLARVLEQDARPGALLQLQRGTGETNLFLIHPASGSLNIYHRLLEHVGPEPTVYGLQAVWNEGVGQHRTMHAMADHYATQIRSLPGPCILAGLSLGARIALHVAGRLPPGSVRLVVLLDGWGPGYPRFRSLPVRLAIHLRRTSALPPGQRLDYLRIRARAVGELLSRHLRRVVHGLWPAADFVGYLSPGVSLAPPPRYEGRVLLVRAQEQPVACLPDPRRGWTEELLPDLDIVDVPGYHGYIMHEPNVARVAEVLKGLL